MFSNPKKFLKKNILLIGIVVLVIIIIAVYFLYVNFKEGFDGPAPVKAQLIPVSTIEEFYNNLPNQTDKDIVAPVVELYKLFVANYDDAFAVYIQIIAANKEADAAVAAVPSTPVAAGPDMNTLRMQQDQQQAQMQSLQQQQQMDLPTDDPIQRQQQIDQMIQELSIREAQIEQMRQTQPRVQPQQAARKAVLLKWAPQINPGITKVLINAVKWLPTAKQFYDKFISTNYYGLMESGPASGASNLIGDPNNVSNSNRIHNMTYRELTTLTLMTTFINTLYNNDQLSILLGPAFAKSNPNPPLKIPVNNDQVLYFLGNSSPQTGMSLMKPAIDYATNVAEPFMIISTYVIENTMANPINSVIPDTILQLIEQLNTALANDAADQASIMQLTGKLNDALANDATDQATITNLQGKIQTQQSNSVFNVDTNLMPTWTTASTTSPPIAPKTATTATSPAQWTPKQTTTPPVPMPKPMPKPAPKPVKNMWKW
jgi:hypothetical protein